MYDNSFEKDPGDKNKESEVRVVPEEEDFEAAFKDIGEFDEKFGTANENNEFYGEATDENELDDTLINASPIVGYLNAAAREHGVEAVVQSIKSFDVSGTNQPIKDFYEHLGVETNAEREDIRDEAKVAKPSEIDFKDKYGLVEDEKKSKDAAIEAIKNMKHLIAGVEGADPKYEELREGARAAKMGYFEYAVKDYGVKGFTELFDVLASQKEKTYEDSSENEKDEPMRLEEEEKKEGEEEERKEGEDEQEEGEHETDEDEQEKADESEQEEEQQDDEGEEKESDAEEEQQEEQAAEELNEDFAESEEDTFQEEPEEPGELLDEEKGE